uniref:Uncharacterized protein n=1 Tax=Arundo donax TaxID=35708 RepID=A0A0A9AHI0_ARUDO
MLPYIISFAILENKKSPGSPVVSIKL